MKAPIPNQSYSSEDVGLDNSFVKFIADAVSATLPSVQVESNGTLVPEVSALSMQDPFVQASAEYSATRAPTGLATPRPTTSSSAKWRKSAKMMENNPVFKMTMNQIVSNYTNHEWSEEVWSTLSTDPNQ